MKYIKYFFIVALLICMPVLSQSYGPFNNTVQDTAWMISSAADSLMGRTITYTVLDYWNGKATLWVGGYSNSDGASADVLIYLRTYRGQNSLGKHMYSTWRFLDTLNTSEVMSQATWNSSNWTGVDMSLANIDDWQWHRGIEFKYKWTPGAIDTIYLVSVYQPKEYDK